MPRLVIKVWTVEPIVVVGQQVYMVMCQKEKMLLKVTESRAVSRSWCNYSNYRSADQVWTGWNWFHSRRRTMYYQVRVPEFQQTVIKFLEWENHNIEEETSDFAMCAHVFCGVLSATYSNYPLKTTTTDIPDQYVKEATEVVKITFYVDDLLTSFLTRKATVSLQSQQNVLQNILLRISYLG